MTKEEQDLRFECLKLAATVGGANCVEWARRYFDFVTGSNDSEILEVARHLGSIATKR